MKQDGYDALKGITLSGRHEFQDILDVLHSRDGFSADEEGNINFIYPVSALPTAHRVSLAGGREFWAMCAIDAIGFMRIRRFIHPAVYVEMMSVCK